MVHLSENSRRLSIQLHSAENEQDLYRSLLRFGDVCFLRLPLAEGRESSSFSMRVGEIVKQVSKQLTRHATLIVFGDVVDLVHVHAAVASLLRYQLWIAIKQELPKTSLNHTRLPHQHMGALIYTKYDKQLQHTKTRLEYTYCPACNKTTKDYGGKKHTYHSYGTLISDVWRDVGVDAQGDITSILERFADLFGLAHYQELRAFDLAPLLSEQNAIAPPVVRLAAPVLGLESRLLNGDCLTQLRTLPDNSIDFAFADPPYNLKKDYLGYADDLDIQDYFQWCDEWISEMARVLHPGGTFALLNMPLWAIRHFLHLETVLRYQNWIVWDALSFPVRMIMPAHYAILCFSKGEPRPLPGLTGGAGKAEMFDNSSPFKALAPMAEGYCLRAKCVATRKHSALNDRGNLSDIWADIHRLKHNTRRVDHPCQLPPQLMYRLIALFTKPGEIVLDCFNGAGTTTLAAHQLGRRYIGIELEQRYYQMAVDRHKEVERGLDPFRKAKRELTTKNSPVARLKKQKYEVPKKTLQLEVRRVAQLLGRLPNRNEMIEHGQYPIQYYDDYFNSWGEVCAAARTSGMSETREESEDRGITSSQPRLL